MRLAIFSGVVLATSLLVTSPVWAQSHGAGQGHGQRSGGGGGGRGGGGRHAARPTTTPAQPGSPTSFSGGNAAEIDPDDPPAIAERRLPPFHVAPPKKHRKILPTTPIATYPGFQMLDDGSSRVFVEVSRKVDVIETKSPSRVSYRIKGAFAPDRTNRLALLTDFFRSPVDRVQLVEDGEDLELVVDLREASDVQHRVVDTEGGILLQVDFGKSARPDAPVAQADVAATTPATRGTETKRIGTPTPSAGAFSDQGP